MKPVAETRPAGGAAAQRLRSPPLTIRGVSKKYGRVTALDNIDLDVGSGEFLTLLGASGSGKTTLLMILAGFIRPNSGSILVGDDEIITAPPHKRDIGMVFQSYALFPHMNVFDNVAFPLRQRRVAAAEMQDRVRWALDLVQLGDFAERSVDQLSGGQKQRVALARALVFEPRILLMDEPLSALDKQLREHMQIEIRRLHERLGMTTVYVTHDQREALTLSDRVVVIADGCIAQIDSPQGIYERPINRYVAEFIGESSFLPVSMKDGTACFADAPLKLAEPPAPNGSEQFLVMRPEKLWIATTAEDAARANIFDGTVEEIVYQGESVACYVRLDSGQSVMLRSHNRANFIAGIPAIGTRVLLGLNPQDAIVVPERS